MQTDMHFYGTYVIARSAGIPKNDARILAYAAQYVDDSSQQDSETHEDKGLLYGIATAHHPIDRDNLDEEDQRRVWVPFHFMPGGAGDTLEERLLCVKDSDIANEMMQHHIRYAKDVDFGMHLLGIAAHVYMDTFSHYGFSGISSNYNKVNPDSFEFPSRIKNKDIWQYIKDKFTGFQAKIAEDISGLGHGGVATYPDRPFLHWRVTFEKDRPGNSAVSDRDNPKTYLEGWAKLHDYLSNFAKTYYTDAALVPFKNCKDKVDEILRFEGKKQERIDQWTKAISDSHIYPADSDEHDLVYDAKDWEEQKKQFHEKASSQHGIDTDIYRFHQAAAHHRYYVLKELLPKHKIAVY